VSEIRDDNLMSHEYDGIREYDNPTPGWWHAIFIGSVVFSIAYFLVFHISPQGPALRPEARHAAATERAAEASYGRFGELTGDRARLVELSANTEAVATGASIFSANCAACHGQQGEGLVGPNLTDDFAKNVKMPEDVYATVMSGIVEKGMPAWAVPLGKNNAVLVASYVVSLRGKNVQGIKPAEGEEMPAWPAPAGG
jgi:cytochrome c oxidase cbb3-type subunit 3